MYSDRRSLVAAHQSPLVGVSNSRFFDRLAYLKCLAPALPNGPGSSLASGLSDRLSTRSYNHVLLRPTVTSWLTHPLTDRLCYPTTAAIQQTPKSAHLIWAHSGVRVGTRGYEKRGRAVYPVRVVHSHRMPLASTPNSSSSSPPPITLGVLDTLHIPELYENESLAVMSPQHYPAPLAVVLPPSWTL